MLKRKSFAKHLDKAYQFGLRFDEPSQDWQDGGLRASTDVEATILKL